ncbi:MAG TPA: PAS domain-containing protein, partial [Firmicutes bacterium]|nr:PAS domain-containing protein [Bacillota bacterium]
MEMSSNELLKFIGEPTEVNNIITTVMNHLPDPAFVLDKNGTVIIWNRSISELTGVEAGSIIGKGNYEH